jgi:hypothetical protein
MGQETALPAALALRRFLLAAAPNGRMIFKCGCGEASATANGNVFGDIYHWRCILATSSLPACKM